MVESKFYVSQDQAKVMQLELDRTGYRRPGGSPRQDYDMTMVAAGIVGVFFSGMVILVMLAYMCGVI